MWYRERTFILWTFLKSWKWVKIKLQVSLCPFCISWWNAKSLLCKTETSCYNIDEPYHWKFHSEKQRDNWLFSQSHKVACLRAFCNLRPSCSLSAIPAVPPPDALLRQEQWALLQAHHWSHPALRLLLVHLSRTGSTVSFMPSYVKKEDTRSFFFSLNAFSPHCGVGNEAVGIKWPWEWSWPCWGRCSSPASPSEFLYWAPWRKQLDGVHRSVVLKTRKKSDYLSHPFYISVYYLSLLYIFTKWSFSN